MLNETSAHLRTLGNNSCTRKGSPTIIYLLKVSSINTRKNGKICSKLPLKTLKQRSTISNVDVEHISHLLLLFLMLTLSKQMFAGTHPINLKTLKLFWQSLTDVQIFQWNNYSKLVIPKKHFFLCTVYLTTGNSLFQSTVFRYFTKIVAAIHSSTYTGFIIECRFINVYTMYLINNSI